MPEIPWIAKAVGVGTLHEFKHQSLHLQRLAPLVWSLITITMKSQEKEAKAPDDSTTTAIIH